MADMDQQTHDHEAGQQQDPLYELALKVVKARPDRICVANIQRTLRIGYNRATALVDRMVVEGVLDRAPGSLGGQVFKLKQE